MHELVKTHIYDTPDGTDCLQKAAKSTQVAAFLGLCWHFVIFFTLYLSDNRQTTTVVSVGEPVGDGTSSLETTLTI